MQGNNASNLSVYTIFFPSMDVCNRVIGWEKSLE